MKIKIVVLIVSVCWLPAAASDYSTIHKSLTNKFIQINKDLSPELNLYALALHREHLDQHAQNIAMQFNANGNLKAFSQELTEAQQRTDLTPEQKKTLQEMKINLYNQYSVENLNARCRSDIFMGKAIVIVAISGGLVALTAHTFA